MVYAFGRIGVVSPGARFPLIDDGVSSGIGGGYRDEIKDMGETYFGPRVGVLAGPCQRCLLYTSPSPRD